MHLVQPPSHPAHAQGGNHRYGGSPEGRSRHQAGCVHAGILGRAHGVIRRVRTGPPESTLTIDGPHAKSADSLARGDTESTVAEIVTEAPE
jgi:hypothetical protein